MRPHDVKARVAEGGDGVEDRHPYSGQAEVDTERRQHEYGTDEFYSESQSEYK